MVTRPNDCQPDKSFWRDVVQSGGERSTYMYTVYVLKNIDGKLYKGMTNDLKRRLIEHKSGKTITTSKMKNFVLIYKEEYLNFEDARKRELYFKSAAGRRCLKNKL